MGMIISVIAFRFGKTRKMIRSYMADQPEVQG
jgi:hypothetical protein